MRSHELNLLDKNRDRSIPVAVYLPKKDKETMPVVIFGPGYQDQEELSDPQTILAYKNYHYLAEYFTNKGYAFISIQHDILGDNDGLETLDYSLPPSKTRKHLWERGETNIFFVINELKKQFSQFNFDKFIISGHSNGGDIAKFFANNHEELTPYVICFDARRCPISPCKKLNLLMFEATDTSTDIGVIPSEGTQENPQRINLEWITIKPKKAIHISYFGDLVSKELKQQVYNTMDFFFNNYNL